MNEKLFNRKNRIPRSLVILIPFLIVLVIVTCIALFQFPAQEPGSKDRFPGAFFYPAEINSEQRLPLLNFAVHKIFFSRTDKNRGWLIGDRGTVLYTSSLGRVWQKQDTPVATFLTDIHMAADNATGWITGSRGTILHTVNGGLTWQQQEAGVDAVLLAVHFAADRLTGWITTADGRILYTANGGINWEILQTGLDTWLGDIFMTGDNSSGWIAGGNGLLLHREGRYADWQISEQTPGFHYNRLHFSVNGTYGWIAGDYGMMRYTSDGGKSWIRQQTGVTGNLLDVFFLEDNQTGWAAGEKGLILTTRNGGNTWQQKNLLFNEDFTSIAWNSNDKSCWLGSADGTLFVSRDEGNNWQAVTRGASQFYSSLFFSADNRTAWAPANDSYIHKTTDRGKSWQKCGPGTGERLNAVYFLSDNRTGWAAGENETILYTENGGKSWSRQYQITLPADQAGRPGYARPFPLSTFYALRFAADGKTGWIAGSKGAYSTTSNGGALWVRKQFPGQEDFRALYFSGDKQLGWIAGERGVIYHSADGGASWERQPTGMNATLRAIGFAEDNRKGWAAGDDGILLATEDGGMTWHLQPLGVQSAFEALHIDTTGRNCWAAGASGIIYHTSDGGQTWSRQETGIPYTLSDIHFADNNLQGWACGRYMYVLYTEDGGSTWQQINTYRRLPAVWYYIVLILLIPAAFPAVLYGERKQKKHSLPAVEKFVEELLVTDKPLECDKTDLLGFAPVAAGISRFIRNKNTQPPLTIAITGQWGAGKSSMMNLIANDLKAKRFFPVMFNAWHHQNQEQLLAGLLENIRLQGIPPLWQLRGMVFRLRLFLHRIRRFLPLFLFFIIIYILLYFILSRITNHQDWLTGILTATGGLSVNPGNSSALLQGTGILVLVVNTALFFYHLVKSIRPFGTSLHTFVRNLSGSFNVGKMAGDTGFRYKFAREFREVTHALKPYKLVMLVDDLDRCRPANLITVLEAVNFLTTAGDCIIILGLAMERVEKCIEREFHDEAVGTDYAIAGKGQGASVTAGIRYARQYLEKLINLEIPLPGTGSDQVKSLLKDTKPETSVPGREKFFYKLNSLLTQHNKTIRACAGVLCAVLLAAAAGSWLGSLIPRPVSHPVAKQIVIEPGEEKPVVQPQQPAVTDTATGVFFPVINESSTPGYYPARRDRWRPEYFLFTLPLILLGLYILIKHSDEEIPEDSPLFRNSLAAWEDRITAKFRTPRAVKRFLNRIRYMAMRYTSWRKAAHRLAGNRQHRDSAAPDPGTAIREDILVGLCVLYLIEPAVLKDAGSLKKYINSGHWPFLKAEKKQAETKKIQSDLQMKILEKSRQIFLEIFGNPA